MRKCKYRFNSRTYEALITRYGALGIGAPKLLDLHEEMKAQGLGSASVAMYSVLLDACFAKQRYEQAREFVFMLRKLSPAVSALAGLQMTAVEVKAGRPAEAAQVLLQLSRTPAWASVLAALAAV